MADLTSANDIVERFRGELEKYADLWNEIWQDLAKSMTGILGEAFELFLKDENRGPTMSSSYPPSVYLPPLLAQECEFMEGGDEMEYVRIDEIERLRARVEELEECGTKSHGIFSEAMEQVESERDTLKARVEELERAIETWKDEEQHWKATEMGFLARAEELVEWHEEGSETTVNTCPIAYDILMSVARAGRLVVEAAESDSQNTSESDSERVWSRVDDLDEALERVTWVNWEADNE